jgi:hypothetical protein
MYIITIITIITITSNSKQYLLKISKYTYLTKAMDEKKFKTGIFVEYREVKGIVKSE